MSILLKMIRSVTVEPILFLYMLIIMLENNVLQELIYTKSCLKILQPVNTSICKYESRGNLTEVLQEATFWGKYCSACLYLCTFLTSFYVASWSDRIGRKFIMFVPPIGSFIAAAINCALSVHIKSHIAYFFISATISGLTFGSIGIISSTFGYIADVTTEESRTRRIVVLEAMIFIGGTCGIGIGGLFLKNIDFDLIFNQFAQVFVFEMSVAVIIVVYIWCILPGHSDNVNNVQSPVPLSLSGLFSLNHIKESFKTVFHKRPNGKRTTLLLLLLALVFIYLGTSVQFTLAYYFVKEYPLKWKFAKYSLYNSVQFGVEGAALLIGLPAALYIFQCPDYIIGILGTMSRIAGFIVFGLSRNDYMVYSCAGIFIFSEFPVPVIRSMLSKIVDKHEKGKMFAFTTILQNICYFFSSLTLNSLFSSTLSFFPGFSFEFVAGLQAFALLIFWCLRSEGKCNVTTYNKMENEVGSSEEGISTVKAIGVIN